MRGMKCSTIRTSGTSWSGVLVLRLVLRDLRLVPLHFRFLEDHDLSGWGKAGWSLLLIFLPWLGALIYLIARGKGMGERQMAKMADGQASQEHSESVAAETKSPADQIAAPSHCWIPARSARPSSTP